MAGPVIIVGIGQLAARGFAVRERADASILLALLEASHRVVRVDTVAGGDPPGTVMQLDPAAQPC